jgi:asparagine synthase (glutamine-hydrolysing)
VTALAGFWAYGSGVDPAGAAERMLKAQAIYAPAAPVIARSGDVALGRRLFRLLPEDVFDRGPATAGGSRWTLVADVRLDNRNGLAEALGVDRAEAARLADATLLSRALERWEEAAIDRLSGDFAFAAWDAQRERLLLARDPIGHRPLHYHVGAGFLAFASMPKGLHALPEVPRAPDTHAFARLLALLPESGGDTLFEGIARVPPGHLCIATRSGVEVRRWWNPPRRTLRLKNPGEYQEAVRAEFDRAVSVRLRGAGTAVASHLSGGLDSSAVTATAARLLAAEGQVHAFTSVPREGFEAKARPGRFADEGAHAAAVAALYPNIEHVLVRTAGRSPLESLDRNAFLYDRPVLNLCNNVWGNAILDLAKGRGLSVLLTGQMGNLSFSYNGFERLPALLRRGRLVKLAREALALRRNGIRLESSAAHALGPYLPSRLWLAIHRWRGRSLDLGAYSALDPAAAAGLEAEAAEAAHDFAYRPSKDAYATRLWALGRTDGGAYHKGILGGWGIDMRDPTADRGLIELCLSIPMAQYLRGGHIRALARGAFSDRLPTVVLDETRKGLQAADWYEGLGAGQGEAREQVERLAELAAAQGIFDTERLRRLVEDWPEGGWASHEVEGQYRMALLRGISTGHFLRKALGSN